MRSYSRRACMPCKGHSCQHLLQHCGCLGNSWGLSSVCLSFLPKLFCCRLGLCVLCVTQLNATACDTLYWGEFLQHSIDVPPHAVMAHAHGPLLHFIQRKCTYCMPAPEGLAGCITAAVCLPVHCTQLRGIMLGANVAGMLLCWLFVGVLGLQNEAWWWMCVWLCCSRYRQADQSARDHHSLAPTWRVLANQVLAVCGCGVLLMRRDIFSICIQQL